MPWRGGERCNVPRHPEVEAILYRIMRLAPAQLVELRQALLGEWGGEEGGEPGGVREPRKPILPLGGLAATAEPETYETPGAPSGLEP